MRTTVPSRRQTLRALSALAALPGLACNNTSASVPKPWTPWAPDMPKAPDMTLDKAYALYLAWKKFVGPVRKSYFTGIELQTNGSFKAIHGAAEFAYDFDTKTLIVMRRLLDGAVTMLREDEPSNIADRRLAKQEPYTMGGGQFYINPHPWLDVPHKVRSPGMNTYNLKRDFTDASIPIERFVLDVRWLVFWAFYWYSHNGRLAGVEERGSDRAFRPPEYLERTRPAVEKWARALLAKGEPPDI